ncbi:M56 family metallopeptidase [Flavobacterium sp. FlaQc-57]|uniref:M56 family metallopeptidase n=1 Tax=Flavobacterium sp. FlaQc-57 TaxID=3374186 RepID=UPI0037576DDA
MEALLIFIAKASGLLLLFYCAYYFLLREETFFNSNRWFLLAGLITSVVLPFWVFTKIVLIDSAPISDLNYTQINPENIVNDSFQINWSLIFIAVYSIGLVGFVAKFAFDFYSLNSILKGKKIQQQADFKFVDIKENIAPFSYFDYIVYNSSLYSESELESILEHEKVHSDQNHTFDVLISRVFCVLFWFNPLIWFYKKAIVQNLEFIADKEAAQKISDKKAYQYTLLKITTHENCLAITNHFYQSLIKKRIVMLNKNQSKKSNLWKYCTIIPALTAFMFLFQVEVIAKEKQGINTEISKKGIKSVDVFKIRKTTTDQELKRIAENLKLNHNVDLKVSDLKRNSKNELTAIKVDVKNGTEETQNFQIEGSEGIKDCGIIVTTSDSGTKKISLITENQTAEEHNVKIIKVQNSKTNTDVNTNSNTSTKTNCTTDTNTVVNANVNTTVNADTKTATTVVVTSNVNEKATSNIIISPSSQPNIRITSDKLIMVDGVVVNGLTTEELQKLPIKTMSIFKGADAIRNYGEEGRNGVIVIETTK